MTTTAISPQEIQITSVFFSPNQLRFESFPRKLVYKGREYVLTETK